MKKTNIIVPLLFFLFCLKISPSRAQDSIMKKKSDTAVFNIQDSLKIFEAELDSFLMPRKSHLKLEISYLSNNVYFGRKDSVAIPYITPQIGYYHKSGLYANASASYFPAAGQQRVDLFTVEAGYAHRFNKLQMQLTANKFFYNIKSFNVESEIKATAAAAFSYDFSFITPVVQGNVIFGSSMDFAGSFGLEHTFYGLKNKLLITPSATANASTQNYYAAYYLYRRYSLDRLTGLHLPLGYTIKAEVLNPSAFQLLDYEFSIPVSYTAKRFTFSFTPVYSVPLNPAILHRTDRFNNIIVYQKDYYEKLNNSFYFQAGIEYKL